LIENHISMITLLANLDFYHNKPILVEGFLKLEHEGNCLYLHKEDYEQGLSKNSIWVEVTESIAEQLQELNLRYAMIEGVFDAQLKGHFNCCSGTIKSISRTEPTMSRAEFEADQDRYIDRNLQKFGLGPYRHLKNK
jgi:hypothetical protein